MQGTNNLLEQFTLLLTHRFTIRQALSLVITDDQIVVKFYWTQCLAVIKAAMTLGAQVLLLCISGINISFFPLQLWLL